MTALDAQLYWHMHPRPCEHEGCNRMGEPCFIHWDDTEPEGWYCEEHMFEAGYCRNCGLFYGAVESFEFGGDGLCESCRRQLWNAVGKRG